jgi:peptidoglycan/xylan/chitin deacetylase (PgdA/CDA1 family)
MERFFPDENIISEEFYLSKDDIREMSGAGMIIGSHTVNHSCMSKLTLPEQASEIALSFDFLDRLIGGLEVKTFCYPYGGFHSFTDDTVDLLVNNNCDFSFNVEPRDISRQDLHKGRQFLPRFDCNAFPHGACRKNGAA